MVKLIYGERGGVNWVEYSILSSGYRLRLKDELHVMGVDLDNILIETPNTNGQSAPGAGISKETWSSLPNL